MDLDVFFKPGSVAVFGASRNPEKPGRVILENLLKGGYGGEIYPLNPKAREIDGVKVYSPEELPDVDLAIFAIRAEHVPPALENVAEKIKGALIVAGGFGEVGRKDLDAELMRIREEYGIRIWGPNCLGVVLGNPLDLTGDATPEMFDRAIEEVKHEADVIFVILLFQLPRLNEKMAQVLEKHADKPVLVISPPGEAADRFNQLIKLPVFETPDKAVGAFRVAYEASSKIC